MRNCFSCFFFTILFFTSCKKDPQNLIDGTWDIQSVKFNGIEKKDDSSLNGIVKYEASYDEGWKKTWDGSYGVFIPIDKNNNEIRDTSNVLHMVYLSFPLYQPDTINFSGAQPRISGSFLPGMIDSVLNWVDYREDWRILEFKNHKLTIQLIYLGNTYQVEMIKE